MPCHHLIEAESFAHPGGWQVDTQFTFEMGSCYLLAHGLGRPVEDARTRIALPAPGRYFVFVRTLNWATRLGRPGSPGAFGVSVGGQRLETVFGLEGEEWHWQPGGSVEIGDPASVPVALHDMTGFGGRVDAIYFTTDPDDIPPGDAEPLAVWRARQHGWTEKLPPTENFDLVVVGGGYSGLGASISAARQGLRVALVQDRPVLGGNGSSDIRVYSKGRVRIGKYPMLGDITSEFADRAQTSPGPAELFGDDHKRSVAENEPNLTLFLNQRLDGVRCENARIQSVRIVDTRSSEVHELAAPLFADTTGHGWLGILAGADYEIPPPDVPRMGSTNQWLWSMAGEPSEFPHQPWMLELEMGDFPYPYDGRGSWRWESGYFKDTLRGMERIRDWNWCALFGAFSAMKNGSESEKHRTARLDWVAHIAGTRESARLLGEYVLSEEDLLENRPHPDGTFPASWPIDMHFPSKIWAGCKKYPDNPFNMGGSFQKYTSELEGYPVPYRCLYSRNITNLFMAGRNVSVSRKALGSVRVMQTCGMAGEVVGKAAAVCLRHDIAPRELFPGFWPEFETLLRLPGSARRSTTHDAFPENNLLYPLPVGVPYIDPASLPGLTVCDDAIVFEGRRWFQGEDAKNFVGYNYYRNHSNDGTAVFPFSVPRTGRYEVRFWHLGSEQHSPSVPTDIEHRDGCTRIFMDLTAPPTDGLFSTLGVFDFEVGRPAAITIDCTKAARGFVVINALNVRPAD